MKEYEQEDVFQESHHRTGEKEVHRAAAVRRHGGVAKALIFSALAAFSGCAKSREVIGSRDVLRVSSDFGVGPMTPQADASITRIAYELVYQPATPYLIKDNVTGTPGRFRRASDVTLSPREIASKLVGPELGDVRVSNDGAITVTGRAGASPPEADLLFLDSGPFEQESYGGGRLVLRRRNGRGIHSIEFVDVGSDDEQWRRFLARDVDLVPLVGPTFRPYLSEVPSVRVIEYADPSTLGLMFRVDKGPFADLRLRRAVSLGLHRAAIARSVFGSGDAAARSSEDDGAARRILEEIRRDNGGIPAIHLTFLSSLTEHRRAAVVLEQQLDEIGLNVKLEPRELPGTAIFIEGSYEFALAFAGVKPVYYRRALTKHPSNITGYTNPDFDQAVAKKDESRATEILERDLPMTPLVTLPESIAIDRRFCGARPKVNYDLSWLAAVHVCADGEDQ